jgi:succinate dehydrogenase / fumarate reductase cytochrome b subunit
MTNVTQNRPLSPHLSIYKQIPTMVMSIVHRFTGMALYAGTLLVAWWLVAAASGEAYFDWVNGDLRFHPRSAGAVRLHLGAAASHARRHPPFHLGHRTRLRSCDLDEDGLGDDSRARSSLTILVWIAGYAARF